jgi:hypothetical protein
MWLARTYGLALEAGGRLPDSPARAIQEARHGLFQEDRENQNAEADRRHAPGWFRPIHGSFFEGWHEGVWMQAADVVVADPPWGGKYRHLYPHIESRAYVALKPGGFLLLYHGLPLPDVFREFTCLPYAGLLVAPFSGGFVPYLRGTGFTPGCRPILVFRKPPRTYLRRQWWPRCLDTHPAGTRDTRYHRWQQALPPLEYWLRHLTRPGSLVVDFFIGGGTVQAALARLQGRRCIGFDTDASAITATLRRLRDMGETRARGRAE